MDAPGPRHFSGGAEPSSDIVPVSSAKRSAIKRIVRRQIPDDVLNDEKLKLAMKVLPENYNFEIMKTVWRLKQAGAKHVALQFPEGLLMYACVISDILQTFAGVQDTVIMGDVTFGACCVDDFSAQAVGADFLVHYGHSCLVPVSNTTLPCMYVFVDIQIDFDHLVETVLHNFERHQRILLAGTIQFASTIHAAKKELEDRGCAAVIVPQAKPLSAGEILGCTAPVAQDEVDVIVFLADGRFHLEALMIANPATPAYRYDPYGRMLTREHYDQQGMRLARRQAVERARSASAWGLVLGTLGRQGNPSTLKRLQEHFDKRGLKYMVVLLSEVTPAKLKAMPDVDAWVQVACPRLSIDWGDEFVKPTLTPYEAFVCLGVVPAWWDQRSETDEIEQYPMDYYARDGGEWNSSYHKPPVRKARLQPLPEMTQS